MMGWWRVRREWEDMGVEEFWLSEESLVLR